jgi:hypothetical protein
MWVVKPPGPGRKIDYAVAMSKARRIAIGWSDPVTPNYGQNSLIFHSDNALLIRFWKRIWDRAQKPVLAER